MSEVPVKALVGFERSANGIDRLIYDKGQIYTLPAPVATLYAKLGKVEILKPAKDSAKPKQSRKKKTEPRKVSPKETSEEKV